MFVVKIQIIKYPQLPTENPSKPSSPSCLKIRTTSQRFSLRLSHKHSHIRHKTAIVTFISAVLLSKSLSVSEEEFRWRVEAVEWDYL